MPRDPKTMTILEIVQELERLSKELQRQTEFPNAVPGYVPPTPEESAAMTAQACNLYYEEKAKRPGSFTGD